MPEQSHFQNKNKTKEASANVSRTSFVQRILVFEPSQVDVGGRKLRKSLKTEGKRFLIFQNFEKEKKKLSNFIFFFFENVYVFMTDASSWLPLSSMVCKRANKIS